MSENSIKKFQEILQGDKKLEEQFRQELEHIDSEKLAESGTEAIIKAAKALGYELTEADMDKVKAELQALDPEELKNAAGGGWCWGSYACYTVYHHDGDKEDETCWKDYACMAINKGDACEGLYKDNCLLPIFD